MNNSDGQLYGHVLCLVASLSAGAEVSCSTNADSHISHSKDLSYLILGYTTALPFRCLFGLFAFLLRLFFLFPVSMLG